MAVRRANGDTLEYWRTLVGEDVIEGELTAVNDRSPPPPEGAPPQNMVETKNELHHGLT